MNNQPSILLKGLDECATRTNVWFSAMGLRIGNRDTQIGEGDFTHGADHSGGLLGLWDEAGAFNCTTATVVDDQTSRSSRARRVRSSVTASSCN
jgi:hypothetical protein